ncbi:MAG: hypothetical protein WDZ94_04105 [Patescibacteria group bacterium]
MQTYTWHTRQQNIDSPGTIHQILAYGNLNALNDIKKAAGEERLKKIFLEQPQKVYTPSALHFISKFILHIGQPIDETRYLKTTPRYIG